jgi:hypothetical protein
MSEATYDEYEDEYDYDEEYDHDFFDEDDYCYECTGYGDDYFVNKDGELESACPTCPHNRVNFDDDWDD